MDFGKYLFVTTILLAKSISAAENITAAVAGDVANSPPTVENKLLVESIENENNVDDDDFNANEKEKRQKGVISDIEKLKIIGEILQNVSEKVIPGLINSRNESFRAGAKKVMDLRNSSLSPSPLKSVQLIHALKKEADELTRNRN